MTEYNFNQLEFSSASNFGEVRRARIGFPNGYEASVIIGEHSYGGPEGLYELAVLHGGELCCDTPISDDVIGHLSEDEVTRHLNMIAELPAKEVN